MAPNQAPDPSNASIGGRVPARVKSAFVEWTHHLNGKDPYTEVNQSHLLRQASYEFMLNHWDEIPDDVKEDVDREWLENQVEDGIGVEL